MPKVALSSEFLEAFSQIPRSKQKKVKEFINRFQTNPYSNSINYEKIHNVQDDRIRTARIDLSYRAVILHPDKGDVFILVWVDHHDEAMSWAEKKTFNINPTTGALQVLELEEITKVARKIESDSEKKIDKYTLFETFPDKELLKIGLPEILLPSVKAINTSQQLDALQKHLPEEAYEALFWIANLGYSIDQAISEVAASMNERIDTDDFEKALEHPDSKRRFAVVQSVDEMVKMLNAPLEKWRVFLHPSQSNLVTKVYNGPVRILGGAGTGKTVVALHRAQYLSKNYLIKNIEKILLTTYTTNLAKNIRENLKHICGDELKNIEVINLHSWASQFLQSQDVKFNIATQSEIHDCWRDTFRAIDPGEWTESFIRTEWEHVIQANGIRDKNEYLRTPRIGRGKRLSRPDRAKMWEIFEEYIHNLSVTGKSEWIDLIRETRKYLEQNDYVFPYRAIIVDETQDFHTEELKLIRAIIPEGENDIFLVGDAHQRIYGQPVVLSRCGINIRGRSKKLKINYRTTEEIGNLATSILIDVPIDDMDGQFDEMLGYKALLHGPEPKMQNFKTLSDEIEYLKSTISSLLEDVEPHTICIVARKNTQIEADYIPALKDLGVPFVNLETEEIDANAIRVGTMHRVKGLEFHHMILVGVNEGLLPLEFEDVDLMDENYIIRERCLLHVAASRARDSLTIISYGPPSEFLNKLKLK
jgi:mRNA-degrading endonuclease RelE of RelBE toxin-antitoxin system